MRFDIRLTAVLAFLLPACGGERKAESTAQADSAEPSLAAATAPPVLLLCGADTVSVQGTEAELQLHVHGESFLVRLTPSASGAKYQAAGDSTTFYWNHGPKGLVQVRGDLMPECDLVPGA